MTLGLYGAVVVLGLTSSGEPGAARAVEPPLPITNDTVVATPVAADETSAIRIDGILDEAAWSDAQMLTGLRQQEPDLGAPATERTEVRVTYDADAIYVGVMAYDSEPDEIIARIRQRDRIMQNSFLAGGLTSTGDDMIAIVFDPFHDHRNGVVFGTNPNGAEFDALITDEGASYNIDWRGTWTVQARTTPEGWSAEFRIPLRTLRYPGGEDQIWGFNVYRMIQRKQERVLWRSWSRDNGGIQRISQAGHIEGLDLPTPRPSIEAKPFMLGSSTKTLAPTGRLGIADNNFEVGLDLKSEVRPGLVLDATINTDFAQVEVDNQRVNLTRFDLFFPEKRDFFLENAGTFQLGVGGSSPGEPPPYMMFFSRRIGISNAGEIPIRGGARLTGRVGGQTVGFMNVQTGSALGVDNESFSVGRVKRDVGENGFLGAMLTDRRRDGYNNTVAGIDGRVFLTETFNVSGFATRSFTSGEGGEGITYQGSMSWNSEKWGMYGNHLSIAPEARADMGFVTRGDIRRSELYGRGTFRPGVLGVRSMDIWFGGSFVTPYSSGDDGLLDWSWGPYVGTQWGSGEFLGINAGISETRVESAFRLAGEADVPAGVYDNNNLWINLASASSRRVSASASAFFSDFYGGSLKTFGGNVTVRPGASFSATAGLNRNTIDVPGGSFVTNISTLRTSIALSTRFTADALVQYNSLSREVSANVRLNFIHNPGSDLFLVITESRGGDRIWDVNDRGVVMKLTYLARL